MSEQKQLALVAVQIAAEDCRVDPKIYEKGLYEESIKAINEAEQYFIDAIEGRILANVANGSYKNFDQATAKLVILSVEFSEIFDALMANICDYKPFNSYIGFTCVQTFLRVLTDDHSYVLDREGDEAIIVIEDGYLLSPSTLHDYLSHLV